jgi:hypothetical protein
MKIKAPDLIGKTEQKGERESKASLWRSSSCTIAADADAKRANELCPLPPGRPGMGMIE